MDLWGLLSGLVVLGGAAVEARRHSGRLRGIPHRIHVNGTRGKSSVVRLVAAGLRAGGLRVVAKTTGAASRVILPDGDELDLRGRRRPSLQEYLQVAAIATRQRADALVVECMALRPEHQRAAQQRLLRATIGVLTGAGLDHLGVMGDSVDEIAQALAETIPTGGVLITPGPPVPPAWVACAAARGTIVRTVMPNAALPLPTGYVEWSENLAIALETCAAVGIDRSIALTGMRGARPDPGALRIWRLSPGQGIDAWLVASFGANDPASTRRAVERVRQQLRLTAIPPIGVLNTRADRGERTLQWCRTIACGEMAVNRLVISGPHAAAAARLLVRHGWARSRVRVLAGATPAAITAAALADIADGGMVVGMGNIAGVGRALLAHWAAVGQEIDPATLQDETEQDRAREGMHG